MYAGSGTITLLNASFEPLSTNVSLQRAARLLVKGKAVVLEAVDGVFLRHWPWPKVLILVEYVTVSRTWLYGPAPYSRRGVLLRDRRTCAYCGASGADTIDHVIPRSRPGGVTGWLNCVASCEACNALKRNRTPEEAGMPLRCMPRVPSRYDLAAG